MDLPNALGAPRSQLEDPLTSIGPYAPRVIDEVQTLAAPVQSSRVHACLYEGAVLVGTVAGDQTMSDVYCTHSCSNGLDLSRFLLLLESGWEAFPWACRTAVTDEVVLPSSTMLFSWPWSVCPECPAP